MKTQKNEFLKNYQKVKSGKKNLSDTNFKKFKSTKSDNLNSLGKFFADKKLSLQELDKIAREYDSKEYIFNKYICVVIPKGVDGYRPILVPHPRDRILFSFILELIKPVFLQEINKYMVFGSGKRTDFPNVKRIIEEIQKESKKHKYILKLDICKFFPSINKDILFEKMKGGIKDDYIFDLIKKSFNNDIEIKYTKNFSKEKKEEIKKVVRDGIPQGCAYSPLLANFYALEMDEYAKEAKLPSFRYLDDMIVFLESREQANKVFSDLKSIGERLNLKIHEISEKSKNKTYVQQSNQTFEYLGIEIKSDGTFKIPLNKIKSEIYLIKNGIFNKVTIKRFGSEKTVEVLLSQLSGWKRYYEKNFPSAYSSMMNRDIYNKDLKKYYGAIIYNKGDSLEAELSLCGFNINDPKFYL